MSHSQKSNNTSIYFRQRQLRFVKNFVLDDEKNLLAAHQTTQTKLTKQHNAYNWSIFISKHNSENQLAKPSGHSEKVAIRVAKVVVLWRRYLFLNRLCGKTDRNNLTTSLKFAQSANDNLVVFVLHSNILRRYSCIYQSIRLSREVYRLPTRHQLALLWLCDVTTSLPAPLIGLIGWSATIHHLIMKEPPKISCRFVEIVCHSSLQVRFLGSRLCLIGSKKRYKNLLLN